MGTSKAEVKRMDLDHYARLIAYHVEEVRQRRDELQRAVQRLEKATDTYEDRAQRP
jgi:hypothetical protein